MDEEKKMHPKEKIIGSLEFLSQICQEMRERDERVVLTSGCFDLLHGGHLEYLHVAAQYGTLVVGINNDQFVRKLKGPTRPVRDQDDRAFTMAGFYPVRWVAVFGCDYQLIEAVKPHVYIASATSVVQVHDDEERMKLFNKFGTMVVELGHMKQDSTTDIIRRATGIQG